MKKKKKAKSGKLLVVDNLVNELADLKISENQMRFVDGELRRGD